MLLDIGAVLSALKGRNSWCPEGTIENSPAFQRWVGRQKVASPEGATEQARGERQEGGSTEWLNAHRPMPIACSINRPFGTCAPWGIAPGVKTPGYSQHVPPGQRNVATAFSPRQATRFIGGAFKAISRPRCPARKMWATLRSSGERAR